MVNNQNRRWRKKPTTRPTRVSEFCVTQVQTYDGNWSYTHVPEEVRTAQTAEREENNTRSQYDTYRPEKGDAVYVTYPTRDGHYEVMDLTKFTEAELEQVKYVLDLAFAAAKPLCKERDENAKEAEEAGEGLYDRSYRLVPKLSLREGKKFQHSSSVQQGHQDFLDLVRRDGYRSAVLGPGQLLANPAEENVGGEDDQSESV